MKKILAIVLCLLAVGMVSAQGTDAPYYLPGEGMYLVGMPSTLKAAVSEPTIVTQAYQSRIRVFNTDVASIKAGRENYNISDRISDDGTILDLVSFMGVGNAFDLTVRDLQGGVYHLGDNSPSKNWDNTHLIAAYPNWLNKSTLPLAVYDQWDCPLSYDEDTQLTSGDYDAVTVDFGNPHEGLVLTNVNCPLVVAPDCDLNKYLAVTLTIWDAEGKNIVSMEQTSVRISSMKSVTTRDGNTIRNLTAQFDNDKIVLNTPFQVTISGFSNTGVHAWLPRAVDAVGIYPTHSTYQELSPEYLGTAMKTLSVPSTDVCVNISGYFNYIGAWGWWDGKKEYGEVVSSEDLVQVYYDPSSPDWPGDYFMGEAAFPVECTFGKDDIIVKECPDWIKTVSYDDSQWAQYGSIQISLLAEALPEDTKGRLGEVVLSTQDLASQYTIVIRQGAAMFDHANGIVSPWAGTSAPLYDLQGRRIAAPQQGKPYVRNGKIYIDVK